MVKFSLVRRLHCPLQNEWENGRERRGTLMPAKYWQGDDLLHMLARANKSNLFTGKGGFWETKAVYRNLQEFVRLWEMAWEASNRTHM